MKTESLLRNLDNHVILSIVLHIRKLTVCVTYSPKLRHFSVCAWVDVIMPTQLTLQIVDGFLDRF